MQEIINLVMASLFSAAGAVAPADLQGAPLAKPVEWSCDPAYWVAEPGFDDQDGLYKGVVGADCQFVGNSGGGFSELDAYLLDQAVHAPEVKKVYAGPIAETYAGMPSVYYDVTMETNQRGDKLTLRNDNHLATDRTTRYLTSTLSKSAQGTGYAAYLKKIGTDAELVPTAQANHYKMKVKALFHVEKPWYVPGGVFDSKFRDEIMKRAHKVEERIIVQIAQHI